MMTTIGMRSPNELGNEYSPNEPGDKCSPNELGNELSNFYYDDISEYQLARSGPYHTDDYPSLCV